MTLLMNLNSMLVKVSARIGFSLFETEQCLKTQPTCKVRHLRYRRPLLCITRAPLVWFLNKGCIMTSNQNPVKPYNCRLNALCIIVLILWYFCHFTSHVLQSLINGVQHDWRVNLVRSNIDVKFSREYESRSDTE